MASLNPNLKRVRKSFGKVKRVIDFPHLIGIQLDSYNRFLESGVAPQERSEKGLHGVFQSVFPIEDFNKTATLEYDSYILESPKYDVVEFEHDYPTVVIPRVELQFADIAIAGNYGITKLVHVEP